MNTDNATLPSAFQRHKGWLTVALCLMPGTGCLAMYIAMECGLEMDVRTLPLSFMAVAVVGCFAWNVMFMRSLWSSGSAIVRATGARQLQERTTDPLERRLWSVLEELALATQLPRPDAFVLDDEPSINALSACTDTANAAVAVTRGALELLSRAELQAMVAHELAHVVQGDMRVKSGVVGARFLFEYVYSSRHGAPALDWFRGWVRPYLSDALVLQVSTKRDLAADAMAITWLSEPVSLLGCLRKVASDPARGPLAGPRAQLLRHLWFVDDDREDTRDLIQKDDMVAPCQLDVRLRALQTAYPDA